METLRGGNIAQQFLTSELDGGEWEIGWLCKGTDFS